MNIVEIDRWKRSAEYVESTDSCIDTSSNEYWSEIYLKDGKYYQLNYLNGAMCSEYVPGKGYVHGNYVPQEVKKCSRMVYECSWETIN